VKLAPNTQEVKEVSLKRKILLRARSLSFRRIVEANPFIEQPSRLKNQQVNLAQFKMALCPLDTDGDNCFLKLLRDELENLKKRLKHEII
jgi:hypothetical protein